MHTLLSEIVKRKKWQGRFELHQVFARWPALVGAEVSRQAQPSLFRGRVLWVDVSDPIWLQQLQFLKMDLLAKLNKSLDGERVDDIRFQLAREPLCEPQGPSTPSGPRPEPDEDEALAMDRLLQTVPDPDLRQAMKRCWHDFYGLPKD